MAQNRVPCKSPSRHGVQFHLAGSQAAAECSAQSGSTKSSSPSLTAPASVTTNSDLPVLDGVDNVQEVPDEVRYGGLNEAEVAQVDHWNSAIEGRGYREVYDGDVGQTYIAHVESGRYITGQVTKDGPVVTLWDDFGDGKTSGDFDTEGDYLDHFETRFNDLVEEWDDSAF